MNLALFGKMLNSIENTWSYSSDSSYTSNILCRRCSSCKILRGARWSCCIFALQETPVQLSCQLLQKSNFPAYLFKIGQKFEFCYEFRFHKSSLSFKFDDYRSYSIYFNYLFTIVCKIWLIFFNLPIVYKMPR